MGASEGAMTREDLFRILAEEVFRDGIVEQGESSLLRVAAVHLDLGAIEASSITGAARRKYDAGDLGEERRFLPPAVYLEVLKAVHADGKVDPDESEMLDSIRALLDIDDECHNHLMASLDA